METLVCCFIKMSEQALCRLVVELDGMPTIDKSGVSYAVRRSNPDVVACPRDHHAQGLEAATAATRDMRTCGFYIHDLAIRPAEFRTLSNGNLGSLLGMSPSGQMS
jgi:hypothetical protein